MQITSNPPLDSFIAARATPQVSRGNGDNESFARLMAQRREQAAEAPAPASAPAPAPPAAANASDAADDAVPHPSAEPAKPTTAENGSRTDGSRNVDGGATRAASDAKSLAARRAESAKLDKRGKTDGPDDVAKADGSSADRATSDDTVGGAARSPADWIAAMAGAAPKPAPEPAPAPAEGDAATGDTAGPDALAGALPPRLPVGATPDPSTTAAAGGIPPGPAGAGVDRTPNAPVGARLPADQSPISLAPASGVALKAEKVAATPQGDDASALALLQSSALAAGGIDKPDRTQAPEPVTSADGAVGAAAAAAGVAPSASRSADTPAVQIATPVHAPEFKEALGVQVSILARDGVQHAQLHLNPADMGPISVQIATEGTQARVDFGADSAATRQILEAGLPELASALQNAGLTLTGGGVSQHPQGGSNDNGSRSRDGSRGARTVTVGVEGGAVPGAPVAARTQRGALDLYA